MKIDFCVPVYNEEKILEKSVNFLYSYLNGLNLPYEWQIVIIDNGSIDKSNEISKKLENDKIKSYFVKNPGRGRAIREYWGKSEADIVSYMDVDLAVNLKHIPELINPIIDKECQLSIGSRLLPDSVIDRNIFREIVSRFCNILYKILFYSDVSDTQCGFKAIRRDKFREISKYFFDDKWFFDTELISYIKYFGYNLKEIPVEWNENRFDKRNSKVKVFKDSYYHFLNFLRLKRNIIKIKKILNLKQ
jgi:glycosyltransferase involved in cell wall biosynthesis